MDTHPNKNLVSNIKNINYFRNSLTKALPTIGPHTRYSPALESVRTITAELSRFVSAYCQFVTVMEAELTFVKVYKEGRDD